MAPGSSNMLRARRRDANVKPNRRLDKKSSRGMLFENEELRMRTITINEEVEKGQSDIKKLRRENEQLRREIWGLRDEYDRLEEIVEDLKDDDESEEESDCEEDEMDEQEVDPSAPENAENAVKEAQASVAGQQAAAAAAATRVKLEFDGLSIVDEETDDLGTPSNDVSGEPGNNMGRFSSGAPSPSRIGWKYGNPASQQGPPGWKFGNAAKHFVFPPPATPPVEGRFFSRMPSQVDDAATLPDAYATLPADGRYSPQNDTNFCGTIILPNANGGDGNVYQDQYHENGMPAWEDNAWGGDAMLPNGQCITVLPEAEPASGIGRIAFAYSYYGNKSGVLPTVVNGKLLKSIYNLATPPSESETECCERAGPDLMVAGVIPAKCGNAGEEEGGGGGNVACVDFVPEFDPEMQKWSAASDAAVAASAAAVCDEDVELRGGRASQAKRVKPALPPKPLLLGRVRRPSVQLAELQEGADQEAAPICQPLATDADTDADDDDVFHPAGKLDLRKYNALLSRRPSIDALLAASHIVSRRRAGEDTLTSLLDARQCEAYRQPASYIRLNSIRPHTLVFDVPDEDVTVQEVIDALDAQLDLDDAVRGVRVVHRRCYVCLARRRHVAALLAAGLTVRGLAVQLDDVSRGSCVVALAGVPHHVTDATVAVIMANYGTVIGEVERRLYKGVDTGERLLRLKPSPLPSQRMPASILVAGAHVVISPLPPDEVTGLGFVGGRDNLVSDSSATYTDQPPPPAPPPPPPPTHPTTATSMDSSIDRFKTQLHVRLKTPEDRVDTKLKYSTIPNKTTTHTNPFGTPHNNNYVLPPVFPFQELAHDPRPMNATNPFAPNFIDHVNPAFNNYSPKTLRKHSGDVRSPTLTRRTLAAHNAATSALGNANQVGLPRIHAPDAAAACDAYAGVQNTANAAHDGVPQGTRLGPHLNGTEPPALSASVPSSPSSPRRRAAQKKAAVAGGGRLSPVRHQTAPNSPCLNAKNAARNARKMSSQSTNSAAAAATDGVDDKSVPNATSSPKPKHGNRKLSVSINEGHVDVSRSSSSGQDSPTKVERRRRVSVYFNNKKGSRRNSAAAGAGANGAIQRSASLDPVRCRFGNGSLEGGNEVTTTCSERERTNSVSSRGSSVGGKRKSRRASLRTLEGADSEKLPWCGCWGNGCL